MKIDIQHQLLLKGQPKLPILKSATVGDGIIKLSSRQKDELNQAFSSAVSSYRLVKFTPASGMGSRLFAFLQHFEHAAQNPSFNFEAYLNDPAHKAFQYFYSNWHHFPFATSADPWPPPPKVFLTQLKSLLYHSNGGMLHRPKALLPLFSKTSQTSFSLFELHLKEALALAKDAQQAISLHFTIDAVQLAAFQSSEKRFLLRLPSSDQELLKVTYSFQDPATDTVALDPQGNLMRDSNNQILWRKSGHGALLNNLNQVQGDIVLIKNIDNIHPNTSEKARDTPLLISLFISLQQSIHRYLKSAQAHCSLETLQEIESFLTTYFFYPIPVDLSPHEKIRNYAAFLNRPLRVCGMIKNEGKPGGGPFWVQTKREARLQIVEQSQMDRKDSNHQALLHKATHFNPVNMVCSRVDFEGNPWNYPDFCDPEQYIITEKTDRGQPLKALELPGLWNGGMAFWNTVFVEIPKASFRSIKSINDCLMAED